MNARVARLLRLLRLSAAPPETIDRHPDEVPAVPPYEKAVNRPPETR